MRKECDKEITFYIEHHHTTSRVTSNWVRNASNDSSINIPIILYPYPCASAYTSCHGVNIWKDHHNVIELKKQQKDRSPYSLMSLIGIRIVTMQECFNRFQLEQEIHISIRQSRKCTRARLIRAHYSNKHIEKIENTSFDSSLTPFFSPNYYNDQFAALFRNECHCYRP